MAIIITTAIIIYFILIAWAWESLGSIEKTKKIVIILIGIILMYGITWIIFQLSKGGIEYQNLEMQSKVQNILVAIFTGINGIIVIPQIGKILDKINENNIEKEEMVKRLVILAIIFIICIIFEKGYMKNTQEGILKIYNAMK
jgi:hypothetical protein